VLFVYAACRLIYSAHTLVFVGFLGMLLGLAVAAGADRLERYRIPRGLGAGLIVAAAIALLVGFGAWTGPTVRTQYRELRERLPEAFTKLDHWVGQRQEGLVGTLLPEDSPLAEAPQPATPPTGRKKDTVTTVATGDSLSHLKAIRERILGPATGGGAQKYVFPVIHSTVTAISGVFLVLFLTIYIGADPALYRRGLIALVPHRARKRWEQILSAAAIALRRWLTTQLIAMLVIGMVSTAVLLVFRVRAALPLGILAGLLEFVPTVGPILSAIPAVAMAFVDSPEKAGAVAVAYIAIQFLENHILIPLLMKEGVDLPPVLTILAQAAMALTFGIMGLFIAVPMLVLVTVLVKTLYVEDVIGDTVPLPFTEQPEPAERPQSP
jgi:predicted PurR-regulated permease PerM